MSSRLVLITGAAGGIGAATVQAFAKTDATLILLDRHKADLTGADGISLAVDLADPDAVAAVFKGVDAQFGRLDAIINVAGINHRSTIADLQLDDWNQMMDVNVGAMFLTAQYGAGLLERGDHPAIVNMSSISAQVASADFPAYVATKAAVDGLTTALARELRPRRIRVNAVAPGWVNAGFTHAAMAQADDAAQIHSLAQKAHLLGRMAQPQEVARMIRWLASPAAAALCGQVVFVDGGLMRVH